MVVAKQMDTYDLFRKLSSGAQFKKNQGIVSKVKDIYPQGDELKHHSMISALDFFGDSSSLAVSNSEVFNECQTRLKLGKHKRNEKLDLVEQDVALVSGMSSGVVSDGEEGKNVPVKLFSGYTNLHEEEAVGGSIGMTGKKKRKKKHLNRETRELLRRQEANAFRNSHHIYVSGSDIPDAVGSFQDLSSSYSLPNYIIKNVVAMGYTEPTPIQMQAIPLMLQKREVLACAPTGSGKTAAFIIPILAHLKTPQRSGFRAVVLSPTRELAHQTYRECVRLSAGSGFKVHVLTKAKANANTFGSQSSQRFDILMTTPNRLVHMLSQEPPALHLHNVEWLVLDEVDKLFEDGPSGFKDQIARIYRSCDHPDIRHAFFSATLASGVEEFCHTHLDMPLRIIIGLPNSATNTVKQELQFVGQESGKLIAIREITRRGFIPPMLVFVQSIERAKELFQELVYDGMNVDVIHSERTQAQRDNVVKCFRTGRTWILVCTDVMGRGIDFVGVNVVLNYDFPPTAISYIHRIGRTGRAGREGKAITFFTEDDAVSLRSIANVMQTSGCDVPDWMMKLKKPSKNTRKMLSKKPMAREQIKTVSKYDLQRSAKKRAMIVGSKRRAKT